MQITGKGYSINAAAKSAEILIYEDIGEGWFGGISAKKFVEDLGKLEDISTINLRINSPGGSVFEGNTIYNALKRQKATINVSIDGLAASIASVIAMAGDTITMAENALMMIHEPWSGVFGTAEDMRKEADLLDMVRATIVNTYVSRTGMDYQTLSDMVAAETWMDAETAVSLGFADSITDEVKLAAHFDMKRYGYRNMPKEIASMEKIPIIQQPRAAFERKPSKWREMAAHTLIKAHQIRLERPA